MAMELYELQVSTSNIHNKLNELGNSLQKETKQNRIEEIVKMMEDPSFWLDRHLSSSLIKEMNNLKNILEQQYEIEIDINGVKTSIPKTVCKPILLLHNIQTVINRGTTLIPSIGGYTKKEKMTIQVVINRSNYHALEKYIKEVDHNAFVTVLNAKDVYGLGFKRFSQ